MINKFKTHRFQFYKHDCFDVVNVFKKRFKVIIKTKIVIKKNFENEIEIKIKKTLIFINYSRNRRIAVKSNIKIVK